MITFDEPDVVYCCFVTDGKYLAIQDSKLYKRKGDAVKRCKKLNIESNYKYRVLAASGWHESEDNKNERD